jgi:hypothetical protein
MTKICSKCKLCLPLDNFGRRKHSKDGLRSECKSCRKIIRLANYDHNKEKEYYNKNRLVRLARANKWYSENKDKKKQYDQQYYLNNKDKIIKNHIKRDKVRVLIDPVFSLRKKMSCAINKALKQNNSSKCGKSCLKYLPYTLEELKSHLEGQFEPWMTWQNCGMYIKSKWDDNDISTWTWQLDHIIPQSDLPYTSMEDDNFKKCWSLYNLRPYNSKQNNLDGVSKIRHKLI